jgi:soluble lytic murein transglycosylase-like protein
MKVESDFNSLAVSKKGAMGLMQIMPQNIKTLRIKDPFNPRENIMGGGTCYFKQLLNRFDGKIKLALAAYHAGPNNVDRYKRIPPFKETEDYVRRVMKYYYAATNQATTTH